MSAWIRMISDDDADETLAAALDRARTPHGTVDNVMRVHSLRPSTMDGHVVLYRACLHDDTNTVPMWFQEVISSYVSTLNDCPYSYANHWSNARHLIGDEARADAIEAALKGRNPGAAFDGAHLAALTLRRKADDRPGQDGGSRCRRPSRRRLGRRRDFGDQPDRLLFQLCQPPC